MKNNKPFFSFSNPMQKILATTLLVVFLSSNVATASSIPRIATCSCYSDASFAYTAEQISLDQAPWLQGIDSVYVLNPYSDEIRYFDVHRWVDDGFQPQGSGSGSLDTYLTQGYFRAEAVPGTGDPAVITSIREAQNAIKSFSRGLMGGVSIDELELPYDSAISLLGPDDSIAGTRRIALRNSLNNYLNDRWSLIRVSLQDLAQRIAGQLLSDSDISFLSHLVITFPDETRISVEITEIRDGIEDSGVLFDIVVRTDTAQGPNLPAVPQSAGQFNGFSYIGNDTTIQELIQLARLYGIPITGPGGNKFKCEIDGNRIKCKVSGS